MRFPARRVSTSAKKRSALLRARPRLEPFEDRCLLAARLTLSGAQLLAMGANVNASNTAGIDESEMYSDVNPTNPLNVAGLVHNLQNLGQIQLFFTMNGGLTWARRVITNCNPCGPGFFNDGIPGTFRFDPSIAFGADGTLYLGYGSDGGPAVRSLIIARSLDGGNSFVDYSTSFAQSGLDKWHLATGPSGTGHDAVYIAFTRNSGGQFVGVSGRRYGVDPGWTVVQSVNDATAPNSVLFAHPAVGPNGELYVTWNNYNQGRVYVDRDLNGFWNGGAVMGTDVLVRQGMNIGIRGSVPVQMRRGVSSNVIMDVDKSGGANHGRVYISFGDRIAAASPNLDIYLATSDNQGTSWTVPNAGQPGNVEGDLGTDWHATLKVDQDTGAVGVAYYSQQGNASNQVTNLWLASSTDGGASFVKAMVSSQPSRPTSMGNSNEFLEYIGLGVIHGTYHMFWADNRGPTPGTFTTLTESNAASACTSGAGNSLAITGTAAADTITLQTTAANPDFAEVLVNGVQEWAGKWCAIGSITIDAQAGDDTVNVPAASGVPITVDGGDDNDTLNVNDQSGPAGQAFFVSPSAVQRADAQPVSHSAVESVSVTPSVAGGTGLALIGTDAGTAVSWVGSGSDYFVLFNGDSRIDVTAASGGTISGVGLGSPLTFSGIASLIGSYADDRFVFTDAGAAAYVDGGGGTDTLDFSPSTGLVAVILSVNYGDRAGYVANIQNLVGSSSTDLLMGDAGPNLIDGGPGDDIIMADEGNDTVLGGDGYDVLLGRGGADRIEGGDGEDLLIDGYTTHDYDIVALFDILLEWSRRDISYNDKINNLRNGGGLSTYLVNSSTVTSDGDVDELLGQGDLDWFWAGGSDILDRDLGTEVLN